jgi:YHS domain-containing protein
MKVDRAKAVVLDHDGQTHYFCSEHCRDRFVGDAGSPTPEREEASQ